MAELQELSEHARRRLELLWTDLVDKHGLTGNHLRWHESREKRREAAKPESMPSPPPPYSVTDRFPPSHATYDGPSGELSSYSEALEHYNARWKAREVDPAVIDSIGIHESVSLAEQAFAGFAEEYFQLWSEDTRGRYEDFVLWLERILSLVDDRIAFLWQPRADWYSRVCHANVKKLLTLRVKEWERKARTSELERANRAKWDKALELTSDYQETLRRAEEQLARSPSSRHWLKDPVRETESLRESTPDLSETKKIALDPAEIGLVMLEPTDAPAVAVPNGEGHKGPSTLSWDAVAVLFLSDERVQILDGTSTKTYNYSELGFEDKRNGSPNQAWQMLRAIARMDTTIPEAAMARLDRAKVQKQIQEIRRVFRAHFSINTDPIPYVSGTGYKARFKIGCGPSFEK